jgi:hypothetical protein
MCACSTPHSNTATAGNIAQRDVITSTEIASSRVSPSDDLIATDISRYSCWAGKVIASCANFVSANRFDTKVHDLLKQLLALLLIKLTHRSSEASRAISTREITLSLLTLVERDGHHAHTFTDSQLWLLA